MKNRKKRLDEKYRYTCPKCGLNYLKDKIELHNCFKCNIILHLRFDDDIYQRRITDIVK